MRVNGEQKDLATVVTETDAVEPIAVDSPEGLSILRHSTAHVLAQAVQRIRPQAKLGIGPPITDGFYSDFGVEDPFTPEDLKAIKKEMERIVRENQRFVRRVVTDDEARVELADEPFKLELIELKGPSSSSGGELAPQGDDRPRIDQGIRCRSALCPAQRLLLRRTQHHVVQTRHVRACCVVAEVVKHPWANDPIDNSRVPASGIGECGITDDAHDCLVLGIGFGKIRRDRAGDDVVPEVVRVQMHRPRV